MDEANLFFDGLSLRVTTAHHGYAVQRLYACYAASGFLRFSAVAKIRTRSPDTR